VSGPVPAAPPLLPDALAGHAARRPGGRAFAFLDDRGNESGELTYGDLHTRSLAVAAEVARHCRPGERAVLLFPPGLDFIVAYFGCLYAHAIPVPISPPRRNRGLDTAVHVLTDSEPSVVLTVARVVEAARPLLDAVLGDVPCVVVDDVAAGEGGFTPRPCGADEIALLQYTSGSTSAPKGVMVSHGNLVANQEMIRRAFGHDEGSTVVGWTPLFHDQGLIGNVLQPIHLGATCILMSPTTFIRWPLLWLAAISRYRAHTSGGPNFAFDACVARMARGGELPELDLSSWKVAFDGAEPLRPDTLRQFADTFAPYGFDARALYPCYGLAEATLIVTGSEKGRGERHIVADPAALGDGRYVAAPAGAGRVLVGSGQVLPGEEVDIVDAATARRCAPGEIGEIWVAGDHVAQGYWRNADATEATFRARCAGEGEGDEARTYLRTGDLGLVVDGELYVTGRLKDLIIIRGRNHYPQDIERVADSAHPAVRPGACAAFSVPGDGGEKLVVVQEIRREELAGADPADVAASIRAAVVREHDLALGDLVLTVPGQVELTSSGKIRRAAARARYLQGDYEVWAPGAPSVVA
jgi:acyl-CoA synthetase (AMP-forming)/AMP-acid ligase II